MSAIYILIILVHSGASYGGPAVVQQEFNSLAACNAAREHIVGSLRDNRSIRVHSQGCYRKS